MKKTVFATGFFVICLGLVSCGGAHGDDPGSAYMPDMYYSRAYETYGYNNVGSERDSLRARGIFYSGLPVPGTVARGEMMSYHLTGDSLGLVAAEALKNPLDSMTIDRNGLKEAERLYLVNCGICHGTNLDGQGPIVANGAYPGAPANFTLDNIKSQSDGHYFHVITYGIRTMGSYASQLTPEQRWWVIKYIRTRQAGGKASAVTDSSGTAMVKNEADSTKQP